MKIISFFIITFWVGFGLNGQTTTYCNPINIDYGYTPFLKNFEWGGHRATADPVIVNYKGDFYLISTNQGGYWVSSDMSDWKFIKRSFIYPHNEGSDVNAPAICVMGDTMLVFGSTYHSNFPIYMSTNPKANQWSVIVDSFDMGGWDPDIFADNDGKLYMYNGSSNIYPIYGIELNRTTLKPIGYRKEMITLNDDRYGWQRFGEHNDNTFLDPFVEGAHITKYRDKYFLQWGGPGTEFSGYADGVHVSHSPLGPWVQQSDPYSYKPGGFMTGAGHGGTFKDNKDEYWHVSTGVISTKNNFERRIGIWPAGFDQDDMMWCNTTFGDYPTYLPQYRTKEKLRPDWYLLNYYKPVAASSSMLGHPTNNVTDEKIKTYWSATTGNKGEWIQSDLGAVHTVNAIQINYADQDIDISFVGKKGGLTHQYILYSSIDGKKWEIIMDKSHNTQDVPHDYIEFTKPIKARFIKLENIRVPSGKFAISGLRVFGKGTGQLPNTVEDFIVLRTEKDPRSCWIRWKMVDNAFAYNIYYGTDPDKLYNCIMVHDNSEYWFKGMDKEKVYYFSMESINENGVSFRTPVKRVTLNSLEANIKSEIKRLDLHKH